MNGKRKRNRLRVGSGFTYVAIAMLLLLLGLTACASGNSDDSAAAVGESNFEAAPAEKSMADQANGSFQLSQTQSTAAEPSSAPEADAKGIEVLDTNSIGAVGPIADANAGFGRQVIYRANLVMKVEKFADAQEQLLNVIHQSNAYVLQFSDSRSSDEIGATYVIKVPSEGFSSFLERMGKIKNLDFTQEVQGTDVTEEFVDLAARLKAKQTVEARLLAFMDKATKTDDLIRFSNELGSVQQEIEQIKGRQRYLEQNVAFSTINLRLYERSGTLEALEDEEEAKNFGERIADAFQGSTKALRQFGEGTLVVLAAMLPIIVVLAIVAVPAFVIIRKRKALRTEASKEKRKAWNTPSANVTDSPPEADEPPKEEGR